MWYDMDPMRLVKKFYSCYMGTLVFIVNGRGPCNWYALDTNPITVSYRFIRRYFTVTVVKYSCTRVTRRSVSVIRVGVAYVYRDVQKKS